MSISATFEMRESGALGLAKATQKLFDVYTVLDLNYSVARSCDKTGRPSGGASISSITVTIRAAKEKKAPFHEWINGEDKKMDGEIKIFDSTGYVSSTLQDTTGTDPLIDIQDTVDIPNDMMGGAVTARMDELSDYGEGSHGAHKPDIYDEASHKDLLEIAAQKGIVVGPNDSDDFIRQRIREKEQLGENHYIRQSSYEQAYQHADKQKAKTVSATKGMVDAAVKRFTEAARCITFEEAYCIGLKEHFVNRPDSHGKTDSSYPWILEISFKPKKVKVSGAQVFGWSKYKDVEFICY